jgi:BMFP domain-containing protein YqiC
MQTRNPILDDLAKVATGAASAFSGLRDEIETRVREQMARLLDGMNLPNREEFEVVKAMAAKAREENDELRARIVDLEAKLAARTAPPDDGPA